jgi:hypothetical protein
MPTLIESKDSGGGVDAFEGSTGALRYLIQLDPSETEKDLRDYLKENTETSIEVLSGNTYNRKAIRTRPVEGLIWEAEISYSQEKPLQISMNTGGGSEKYEYSKRTMSAWGAGGRDPGIPQEGVGPDDDEELRTTKNYSCGINVTKNSIEGVTLRVANPSFRVSRSWAMDEVDADYLQKLLDLTGKVNDAPITLSINGLELAFKKGELLFDGANLQTTPDERLEISYEFSVQRNVDPADPKTHKRVGTKITVTEAEGWDYVWVDSEEDIDEVAHAKVHKPVAVYIERVYDRADFEELNLQP